MLLQIRHLFSSGSVISMLWTSLPMLNYSPLISIAVASVVFSVNLAMIGSVRKLSHETTHISVNNIAVSCFDNALWLNSNERRDAIKLFEDSVDNIALSFRVRSLFWYAYLNNSKLMRYEVMTPF